MICGISFPLFLLARSGSLAVSGFAIQVKAARACNDGTVLADSQSEFTVFGGLFGVGLSLFVSVWGPLVVALILVPLRIARARREERVLR